MAESPLNVDEIRELQASRLAQLAEARESGDQTTVDEVISGVWQDERERSIELRDRVLAGETTGDRFLDFVIVRPHPIDWEAAPLYADLDARVRKNAGQPALVVRRAEVSLGVTQDRIGKIVDMGSIDEHVGMGVLVREGLQLDLPNASWSFPTDKFAWIKNEFHGTKGAHRFAGEMKTGDITHNFSMGRSPLEEWVDQEMRFVHSTDPFMQFGRRTPPWLEIAVGDEEIAAWLEAQEGKYRPRDRQYGRAVEALAASLEYDGGPVQLSI